MDLLALKVYIICFQTPLIHHIPQTLVTLAENLIKDPSNPKYQRFKPTNDLIKRRLIDPKGTLEYAIAVSLLFLSGARSEHSTSAWVSARGIYLFGAMYSS